MVPIGEYMGVEQLGLLGTVAQRIPECSGAGAGLLRSYARQLVLGAEVSGPELLHGSSVAI